MVTINETLYRSDSRIETIRVLVNEMLLTIDSHAARQEACIQLYGVSTFASMLAMKRGLRPELGAIAGLLHDYYYRRTGIAHFPGPNSAEAVRPLLRDSKLFSSEEQAAIMRAIFYQDYSDQVHGANEELIKDAIVVQKFFRTMGGPVADSDAPRLRQALDELAIPADIKVSRNDETAETNRNEEKRSKLADIAESLAGTTITGIPGDEQYREICKYWPDTGIHQVLRGGWCAAFVYHCCMLAGFVLPIRYPNGKCRFAGVGAWLQWAQLPGTPFFYRDNQDGFTPGRGDIVIYEKLLSEESHDHIGIILDCDEKEIRVAEGNRDNNNYSCVFQRDRFHCVLGYVRIDNDYSFQFNGSLIATV